jgi:hypothetical protein
MTTTTQNDLDLATATPAQIDEVLFPLWAERWQYATWLHDARVRVAAAVWPTEAKQRYGDAARYGTNPFDLKNYETRAGEVISRYENRLSEIADKIAPFDAEFERRGGWTRYLFVRAGHLHRAGCSSLRPTTQTYLFAEASGLDATEIVSKYTFTACTKCWKDAPVGTTSGKGSDEGMCPGSRKAPKMVQIECDRMKYDAEKRRSVPTGEKYLATLPAGSTARGVVSRYSICAECGEQVLLSQETWKVRKHAAKTEVSK